MWKAVVAAKTAGIDVVAIRNKADLTEGREACDAFAASLPAAGCPCLTLSAYDADDVLTKLTPLLENKTTLLIGQSGMGKSTLINVLCPEAQAKTREFSEALDLGKQTTTATRLYRTQFAGSKASLIDSPGFQEFGLAHITRRNILEAMPDIAQYAQGCRFYNCTHTHEPGCSVRAAAEAGKVSPERYAFFCAVTEEAKDDVF